MANITTHPFIKRCQRHYAKYNVSNFEDFANKAGLPPHARKSWYQRGVQPIYIKFIDMLDKIEDLEGEISDFGNRMDLLQTKLSQFGRKN